MNKLSLNSFEIKKDVGRNLLLIRKALNLSHLDLVSTTGLTRPILSTIENGSANPTMQTLIKLSSALNISFDMVFMSEQKFNKLMRLLKDRFANERYPDFDFHISPKFWKLLIKYSGNDVKSNYSRTSKICSAVIKQNFNPSIDDENNMILGASLGVLFQKDGFKYGLEFGAWLGNRLYVR